MKNRIIGTEVTLTYRGNIVASCGTITAVSTDDTYILKCPVTMATGVKVTDNGVEATKDFVNNEGIVMNIAEVWVYGCVRCAGPAIGNYKL